MIFRKKFMVSTKRFGEINNFYILGMKGEIKSDSESRNILRCKLVSFSFFLDLPFCVFYFPLLLITTSSKRRS